MKTFLNDNFFLNNSTAEWLYHDVVKSLPIIDFHNHLSPKDIADNTQFENFTQAWLTDDHYKWRAMRALGIDEEYITGGAAWAGSTAGSGFNYKPVDHPAYINSDPNVGDQNPRNNAPPGITLVNIGAPRMIGVDFSYSF